MNKIFDPNKRTGWGQMRSRSTGERVTQGKTKGCFWLLRLARERKEGNKTLVFVTQRAQNKVIHREKGGGG